MARENRGIAEVVEAEEPGQEQSIDALLEPTPEPQLSLGRDDGSTTLIAEPDSEPLASSSSGDAPLDGSQNRDNAGLQPRAQIGQYNVDEFTGLFSYSYPVSMPAGRNDMQPNLALQYNHRANNLDSFVGVGWDLNIPSISRDNRTGVNNLYNEDYFILNLNGSNRLEAISVDANGYGSYGKKVESDFAKVEYSGANKWIVTDKLGTVYTFGASISARQDNPNNSSEVYRWMLEEVRDTNDNFYRYEYFKDSGQIYPKKIYYTGSGQADGIFRIDFEPFASASQVAVPKPYRSYQSGFYVQTKYLLDSIDIYINNTKTISHELALSLNTKGQKYLLDTIVPRFYQDGVESVKDQVDFQYSYQVSSFTLTDDYDLPGSFLGEDISAFDNKRDMFVDLNNDSYVDHVRIFCSNNGGVGDLSVGVNLNAGNGTWLNNSNYGQYIGSGFSCGGLYGVYYTMPLAFAEINGDDLIDMVTNNKFYINTGSSWQEQTGVSLPVGLTYQGQNGVTNQVAFQDMNRDGYDDLIYTYVSGTLNSNIDVYIRDKSTYSWNLDTDYNLSVNMGHQDCLNFGGHPYAFVDLNNDGLQDVFYKFDCEIIEERPQGEGAYLNTGSSFVLTTEYGTLQAISNPTYSATSYQKVNYFSDLDQDGFYNNESFTRYKNNNSGGSLGLLGSQIFNFTYTNSPNYYDYTYPLAIADFNGDQMQDVMHSFVANNLSDVYYGNGTKLDVMEEINYQSGTNVYINYTYSSQEKDSLGNLLNPNMPFSLYVVKEVVVDDSGDLGGKLYTYRNGQSVTYKNENIKDVFGFSEVETVTGSAVVDVDVGDGYDGAFVSSGNEIWSSDKNFTSLYIQSGHTITVESGVNIKVQGTATIDGILSAKGKGYNGAVWPVSQSGRGSGPGRGEYGSGVFATIGDGGSGAGYSTKGADGNGSGVALGGPIYGNEFLEPFYNGSGGGAGYRVGGLGGYGGNGGGIIFIHAGDVVVNGAIDANGTDGGDGDWFDTGYNTGYGGGGGAGSGGSIYIKARGTVNIGNNKVYALGGVGGTGGYKIAGGSGYNNDGGNGGQGRIRMEAKNILGNSNPSYYSLGEVNYIIDTDDNNIQRTVSNYHTAKNDGLYLHGKPHKSDQYNSQDVLVKKNFVQWQETDLGNTRKFVYSSEKAEAKVYIETPRTMRPEFSVDSNTVSLWHMNGLIGGTKKRDNTQGNSTYDLVEVSAPLATGGFNGENDGSYDFDGLDGDEDLETVSMTNGLGQMTVEFWVNPDQLSTILDTIIGVWSLDVDHDRSWHVAFGSSGKLGVFIAEDSLNDNSWYSDTAIIQSNQWQYVSIVYDGSNTLEPIKAYVNAVSIAGSLSGNIRSSLRPSAEPLRIGKWISGAQGEYKYDGQIDEVRISNIAKSATEIVSYYNIDPVVNYEFDVAQQYTYDPTTGNLTTKKNLGKVTIDTNTGQILDNLAGDEKDTNYQYAQNTVKHIISAPQSQIISDTAESKQQDLYYNNQAQGLVDKVNLTKEDYITNGVEVNRSFNSFGLVATETDPEGNIASTTYDGLNLYPTSVENALGYITTYEYNLLNGQVATTTDPNGAIISNKYDAFGRLIKTLISDPNNPSQLITKQEISYNDSVFPRYQETKNYFAASNYQITRQYFDGLDRVIQTKIELDGINQYSTVDTIYDSQGRVERQSLPYITTSVSYSTPNLSQPAKTYTYDALDRVLTEITPVGTTSYIYDGLTTTITDPNGVNKELTKDVYGNLVEVKEPNGVSTYTTSYEYSLTNKLEKITDSAGNERNFNYDALDNLQSQDMVHPSAGSGASISYTHDQNGNVLTENSFKGDAISYVYDNLNRVRKEKLAGNSMLTYIYDVGPGANIGQLRRVNYDDTSGDYKIYDYDILGRLIKLITRIDNINYIIQYDYNLAGNLSKVTYPNGYEVGYIFNNIGQISSVILDRGAGLESIADNISYNQNGQMTHIERANGVVTDYTYDPVQNFRLTNVTSIVATTILQDIDYTYDANGNIKTMVDSSSTNLAKNVLYDYDDLNRLASTTVNYINQPANNYSRQYSYDSIGNMTWQSDLGTFDYNNSQPHQVTSIGSRNFSYDNAGNTLSNGVSDMTWDWRNRMDFSELDGIAGKNYYQYDHNNQRYLKYQTEKVWIPPDIEITEPQASIVEPFDGQVQSEELMVLVEPIEYIDDLGDEFLIKEVDRDTEPVKNKPSQSRKMIIRSQAVDLVPVEGATDFISEIMVDSTKDSAIESKSAVTSLLSSGQTQAGAGGYWETQTVSKDKYVDKYFQKDLADNSKTHIYLGSTKLASANNSDDPYYILSDHLGSSTITVDNVGTLAEEADYAPYGSEVYTNTITDLDNEYRFTGQEYDEENSLQYFGARYMDNEIGRFTAVEPVMLVLHDGDQLKKISGQELQNILSDPQALNSYSYSRNNPVILVDADGNWWKAFVWGNISTFGNGQSWSSFQTELGQAASQLYNDSSVARVAMDNPYKSGVAIGVGSGVAAAGASIGLTALSTQYLGGAGTACLAFCNKTQEASSLIGKNISSLGKVVENASGKISGFNHDGTYHGLDQVISRNVSPQTLLNTIKNPLLRFEGRYDRAGYLTREAYVVLDKAGQVVTTWSKNDFGSTINNLLNSIK